MDNFGLGKEGGLDDSNRTLAGISGLHNRDPLNPITENLIGAPSDAGPGYGLSSYNDTSVEKQIPASQKLNSDVYDTEDTRTVTVLNSEGTFGTRVQGDVSHNFGGVTFEERK